AIETCPFFLAIKMTEKKAIETCPFFLAIKMTEKKAPALTSDTIFIRSIMKNLFWNKYSITVTT
ncbi:MAG: hypothetical protein ACI31W_01100, partial [Lactococcus sp.]